jgi:hypothetical protein
MAWYVQHGRENCSPEAGPDGRWWGSHDQDTDPGNDGRCPATREAQRRNGRDEDRQQRDLMSRADAGD